MKIILASNNAGKLKEIQQILSSLAFELTPQSLFNISDIEETGLSFVENAILKARHAALHAKLPAIADDSGLCLDILQGKPGIYSARFAGKKASSEQNMVKLLNLMLPYHGEQRRASFFCAIALVRHAEDPMPLIFQATWSGLLLTKPRGQGGFGYDPLFYVPEYNCSAAELSAEHKNQISHRAKALNLLNQALVENNLII